MSFAVASFLGSFLLFFLQPYLGKVLTPAFGGGAQVWLVCMVYFQCVLLLGYSYAHLLGRVSRLRQAIIHGSLGIAALGSLGWHYLLKGHPFDPQGIHALGSGTSSYFAILVALARTTLLPLFFLSANAPLAQEWYRLTRAKKVPFRLYAYSNAGSLLGLVAYPFLAEVYLSTPAQGAWVGWGFLAFVGVMGWNFFRLLGVKVGNEQDASVSMGQDWGLNRSTWVAGSAIGVMVLMAGTHVITHKVVAAPLLWVLPLALFLLTFILVFEGATLWSNPRWVPLWALLASGGFLRMVLASNNRGHGWTVLGCGAWVFFGCLMVHGLLYRSRPHPSKLTTYYLAMSLGGVLGGLAMAVGAPLLFDRTLEIPLVPLLLGGILLWFIRWEGQFKYQLGLVALVFLLVGAWGYRAELRKNGIFGRDFYSALRVYRNGNFLIMEHGETNHGMMHVQYPTHPVSYYGYSSGVGRAIQVIQAEQSSFRMGVVGLGAGALAVYLRPEDHGVFYEISPVVDEFAGVRGILFPHLKDAKGKVEVRMGDGRRTLESELKDGKAGTYDLLVIDAFSGDSVPWHLLTCEALQVYLNHLRPGGILAFHLSSPLPLAQLVLNNSKALGLYGALVMDSSRISDSRDIYGKSASEYLLLGRDPGNLRHPTIGGAAQLGFGPKTFASAGPGALPFLRDGRPWTDSRNSLSDLLYEKRNSIIEFLIRHPGPVPLLP